MQLSIHCPKALQMLPSKVVHGNTHSPVLTAQCDPLLMQVQSTAAGAAGLDPQQVAESAESALGRGRHHGAALHLLTDQEGCHQSLQEGPADCLSSGEW